MPDPVLLTEVVPLRGPSGPVRVVEVDGDGSRSRRDRLATEEPLEIRASGPGQPTVRVAVTMRTPGHDFELAAGFLFSEGLIAGRRSFSAIRYCNDVGTEQHLNVLTVDMREPFDAGRMQRNFFASSSCGVCGKASIDQLAVECGPVAEGPIVSRETITSLPATLRAQQRVFESTGGLHATGLFLPSGELVVVREDVGSTQRDGQADREPAACRPVAALLIDRPGLGAGELRARAESGRRRDPDHVRGLGAVDARGRDGSPPRRHADRLPARRALQHLRERAANRTRMNLAAAAAASDAARQHYLFEARQLQALSFAVHIPLVCFGIAFPALVVFCEWLGRRSGDEIYLTIARRWSKVMAALFAAGVVTGTILSFELGILWPEFMARFGAVFGLAFTLEGFSFFVEAIFIGIYIYGWDRMSPRLHLLAGVPIIIAGIAGSLMVITVNGWMNHPGGFRIVDGRVVDVHPWSALFDNRTFWHELVHMYLAGYMVVGFSVASVYAWGWLRGRRGRYERIAIAIPLAAAVLAAPLQVVVGDWAGRDVARYQPIKLAAFEGLGQTTKGAPVHILGWYTDGHVRFGIEVPDLLSLLAFHDPNATVTGLDAVPAADRPPVNVVRIAFQTMVGIGTLLAVLVARRALDLVARRRLPRRRGSIARSCSPGRCRWWR